MARVPDLTIIIPARNEQQTIAGVLRSLSHQERISDCQIFVVDGGSTDGTADIASAFPFVEIIKSPLGLARQMNLGAERASSPNLWFLHADVTMPSAATVTYILDALSEPGVVGGACRFQIRGHDMYYRMINKLVNMRARWLGRAYGDQGLFAKREVFLKLGGFREVPCTDLDFFLRLRAAGETRLIRPVVETSARTWQRYGKLKTTAWHVKEWIAYEWNRRRGRISQSGG